jgi:NAD-dependent dihydropyrimidine dehydrogenase PreA subunit
MAFVICQPCIDKKHTDCVQVCPVDCIHPRPDEPDFPNVRQLYIDPTHLHQLRGVRGGLPRASDLPRRGRPRTMEEFHPNQRAVL